MPADENAPRPREAAAPLTPKPAKAPPAGGGAGATVDGTVTTVVKETTVVEEGQAESAKAVKAGKGSGAGGTLQAKKKGGRGKWLAAVLSALLGSSVIGGLVGGYATYRFEEQKIEARDTRLHETEKREVYTALEKDVLKLESDLAGAVITFNYAAKHPAEKAFAGNVGQAIDLLSDQMAVVLQSLGNPQVDDSVRQKLTGVLNELGPKLAEAQKDPRALNSLGELYNRSWKQRIADANKQIEQERTRLHIENK